MKNNLSANLSFNLVPNGRQAGSINILKISNELLEEFSSSLNKLLYQAIYDRTVQCVLNRYNPNIFISPERDSSLGHEDSID